MRSALGSSSALAAASSTPTAVVDAGVPPVVVPSRKARNSSARPLTRNSVTASRSPSGHSSKLRAGDARPHPGDTPSMPMHGGPRVVVVIALDAAEVQSAVDLEWVDDEVARLHFVREAQKHAGPNGDGTGFGLWSGGGESLFQGV